MPGIRKIKTATTAGIKIFIFQVKKSSVIEAKITMIAKIEVVTQSLFLSCKAVANAAKINGKNIKILMNAKPISPKLWTNTKPQYWAQSPAMNQIQLVQSNETPFFWAFFPLMK